MPPTLRQPEMVVFDAGGVLLRICRSWKEAVARVGLPFHEQVMHPDLIARRRALSREYETGAIGCDEFFPRLADHGTDGLYSQADARVVHAAWIIEEYPGVAAQVAELRRQGRRTAILSNTNAQHWSQFPAFASTAVDHPYASHLLGLAKPDPAIYVRFNALTQTAPDQVLFFDDLPDNVAAARAVGWQAVQIDHTGDTAAQIRAALTDVGLL